MSYPQVALQLPGPPGSLQPLFPTFRSPKRLESVLLVGPAKRPSSPLSLTASLPLALLSQASRELQEAHPRTQTRYSIMDVIKLLSPGKGTGWVVARSWEQPPTPGSKGTLLL